MAARAKSKSQRMRELAAAGLSRANIARKLGVRYQFVRNVLEREKQRQTQTLHGFAGPSHGKPAAARAVKVRIGPDGRLVVPAPLREALALKDGDVLFARLEGDEIHLLTPRAAMLRAQAMVRRFVPEGVSLVDELLVDRRREVERETGRG